MATYYSPRTRLKVAVLVFILMVLFLTYNEFRAVPHLRATTYHSKYRSAAGAQVTGALTPHGIVIAGVELFYMLPSRPKPLGMLVFFHGCQHSGQEFFILPEDRIVALSALNRGLVVVSPTSMDRVNSGCWKEEDGPFIAQALPAFCSQLKIPLDLPRMGMGASSGGAFLFSVYKAAEFKSMVSYIMGRGHVNPTSTLPATGYVHMPRDEQTANAIANHVAALQAVSVPNKEWKVLPHPFTVELCDQRLPELGDRRCQMFDDMIKQKYKGLLLDSADNTVLTSYTTGAWKDVMTEMKLDDMDNTFSSETTFKRGEVSRISPSGHSWLWASVEEEIAASFAVHEMTAEHREEVLDFLMIHAGIQDDKKE